MIMFKEMVQKGIKLVRLQIRSSRRFLKKRNIRIGRRLTKQHFSKMILISCLMDSNHFLYFFVSINRNNIEDFIHNRIRKKILGQQARELIQILKQWIHRLHNGWKRLENVWCHSDQFNTLEDDHGILVNQTRRRILNELLKCLVNC